MHTLSDGGAVVVRPLTLCFSLFLIVLGIIGFVSGVPRWLVALDLMVGALGVGLDAWLWRTEGRGAVAVALVMAGVLFVSSIVGMSAHAANWMTGCMLAFACFFGVLALARYKTGPTPEL
jgi:hypothetical protein